MGHLLALACHQILEERHPDSASWLDAEVEQLLADKACLNAYDDGVNATLLVAAQVRCCPVERRQRAAIAEGRKKIYIIFTPHTPSAPA